jgi:hypothetical protein
MTAPDESVTVPEIAEVEPPPCAYAAGLTMANMATRVTITLRHLWFITRSNDAESSQSAGGCNASEMAAGRVREGMSGAAGNLTGSRCD